MFDLVVQLTGGGPGSLTTLSSIDLNVKRLRNGRRGTRQPMRDLVRDGFRSGLNIRQSSQY